MKKLLLTLNIIALLFAASSLIKVYSNRDALNFSQRLQANEKIKSKVQYVSDIDFLKERYIDELSISSASSELLESGKRLFVYSMGFFLFISIANICLLYQVKTREPNSLEIE